MPSKFLLSRKRIDEISEFWESAYDVGKVTEPLAHFIARRQCAFLLELLLDKGFNEEEAKIELKKILEEKSGDFNR